MSPVTPNTDFRFNGQRSGFQLLEQLMKARSDAQQQLMSQLRRNTAGMPLLSVGLDMLETVTKQSAGLERSIAEQIRQNMNAQTAPRAEGPPTDPAAQARTNGVSQPMAADVKQEQNPPALRVVVPANVGSAVLPLRVRNHRDTADTVALTAHHGSLQGLRQFPLEWIRFEPRILTLEPRAEEWAKVHLSLSPELEPRREYWCMIEFRGAETRQIPLVVHIRAAGSS